MKVYGVVLNKVEHQVELITYRSQAEFLKTESWLDEKFIIVVTSNDIKESYEPNCWIERCTLVIDTPEVLAANQLISRVGMGESIDKLHITEAMLSFAEVRHHLDTEYTEFSEEISVGKEDEEGNINITVGSVVKTISYSGDTHLYKFLDVKLALIDALI